MLLFWIAEAAKIAKSCGLPLLDHQELSIPDTGLKDRSSTDKKAEHPATSFTSVWTLWRTMQSVMELFLFERNADGVTVHSAA